ncbi:MAG: hypothetical protein LBQ43_00800 [Holosporales bacterium]|jgi:hypothetical protein|nr:hypothetical protein [Holosporales bacterium]
MIEEQRGPRKIVRFFGGVEYVSFIKQFVESHEGVRIQNLSSKVNKPALSDMHRKMDRRKANGVDGVGKDEYELHLDENLDGLVGRLKRDTYNPKPTRRTFIPKAEGKVRPLGISCYEDKLVGQYRGIIECGV